MYQLYFSQRRWHLSQTLMPAWNVSIWWLREKGHSGGRNVMIQGREEKTCWGRVRGPVSTGRQCKKERSGESARGDGWWPGAKGMTSQRFLWALLSSTNLQPSPKWARILDSLSLSLSLPSFQRPEQWLIFRRRVKAGWLWGSRGQNTRMFHLFSYWIPTLVPHLLQGNAQWGFFFPPLPYA